MNLKRRSKLLVEPPASATGDIAFNLIVFFLVCASVQPDSGRHQILPRSESKDQQKEQSENIEVSLTEKAVSINGNNVELDDFPSRMKRELDGKEKEEDRVVVVRSGKEVPYHHWIQVTGWIEEAGGVITLQLEEEQVSVLPD